MKPVGRHRAVIVWLTVALSLSLSSCGTGDAGPEQSAGATTVALDGAPDVDRSGEETGKADPAGIEDSGPLDDVAAASNAGDGSPEPPPTPDPASSPRPETVEECMQRWMEADPGEHDAIGEECDRIDEESRHRGGFASHPEVVALDDLAAARVFVDGRPVLGSSGPEQWFGTTEDAQAEDVVAFLTDDASLPERSTALGMIADGVVMLASTRSDNDVVGPPPADAEVRVVRVAKPALVWDARPFDDVPIRIIQWQEGDDPDAVIVVVVRADVFTDEELTAFVNQLA